jgi:hypothetical protein
VTRSYTASRRQLATMRLAAQGIGAAFDSPVEVVQHLLAMQAQDFGGALWAVGLRTRSSTEADVEQAIADRQIVRSWPQRGTLHLVAAEDLHWMLALTFARTVQSAAGRHRALGLSSSDFFLAATIAEAAVGDGVLGRTELLAALDAGGVSTDGQRGAHLLLYLAVTGLLVFGPRQGKQHTFALLDGWVPTRRALEGDEALAELALRYLLSHGPATDRDLAWWSSLTLTQVRRGIAAIAPQLERLTVDGVDHWHRPGLEPAATGIHALPGFDEYVLGYQDRSAQLGPEWAARIVPGGNGMFLPTIVRNGEIVGTWKRTRSTVATSGASASFTRYGRFLGTPLAVT